MSRKAVVRVTFEKGLNEFVESSRLEMGFSTVLRNWIPEPDGSLRCPVGWNEVENTWDGSPAEPGSKKVRGIGYNPKHDHMGELDPALLVANAETNVNPGYRLYHAMASMLDDPMEVWEELEFIGGAGWDNEKHLPMVMAGGRLMFCTDDFPYDNTGGTTEPTGGVRYWNGMTGATGYIANSRPGRTMCYYKNRLFTAGGKETTDPAAEATTTNNYSTQPWRLWFSGLLPADPAAEDHWDTTDLDNPAGYIEIGKDDGQAIEFIVPFDQGILIGKEDSLYYLVGTSPATFALIPLDAGECAPGRSIVVTPYGAIILGRSEAFIFKGNIPEPIDTPVSASYGLTGDYLTGAYIDGAVHVVDKGRDVTCIYDLENDTWRTEVVGFEPGCNLTHQQHMFFGPDDEAAKPLLYHRVIPTGERGKSEGLALSLRASTGEMWLGGVASKVHVRHAYIRYRVRSASHGSQDTAQPLVVKQYRNGALLITQNIAIPAAAGVYRERLDMTGTGHSVQYDLSFDGLAADRQAVDIEELELHIEIEEPR